MAVILVGSEQALLSHLFCDQASVVIGVLVIGDQEPAGAGVLCLQDLISGVVGIGAYGSIRPPDRSQAV